MRSNSSSVRTPPVTELGEIAEVVGRAAPAALHEAAEGVVLGAVLLVVFVQRVAAHDQVGEDAQPREDDDQEDPQRLRPVGEVTAAEDVEHDADRDPDPEEEQRELQNAEQRVAERVRGQHHCCPFEMAPCAAAGAIPTLAPARRSRPCLARGRSLGSRAERIASRAFRFPPQHSEATSASARVSVGLARLRLWPTASLLRTISTG